MPSNVQIHRQVLLNDSKISKETKIVLHKLLQHYETIILKSDNDISQTDLIKMHIATRPGAAPIADQLHPFTVKHHDFVKQEMKNLLDTRIIHNSMSQWASPIAVVKKPIPEGTPQQFCFCID